MAVSQTFLLRDLTIAQKLPAVNSSLFQGTTTFTSLSSSDFTALQLQLPLPHMLKWKAEDFVKTVTTISRGLELNTGAAADNRSARALKSGRVGGGRKQKEVVGVAGRHIHTVRTSSTSTSHSASDVRNCRLQAAGCRNHFNNNGSSLSLSLPSKHSSNEFSLPRPSPLPSPSIPDSCYDETSRIGTASFLSPESARPNGKNLVGGGNGCPQGSSILGEEMDSSRMPRHVAIIMDGNSRWAVLHGLQRQAGHEAGIHAFREVIRLSGRWGIHALTVFAFSLDNWQRSEWEVSFLMKMFENNLRVEAPNLHRENVRVRFVGNLAQLPPSLRGVIDGVHVLTAGNGGLELTVAVSYSAREEMVAACRALVRSGARPEDVTEEALGAALAMHSQVGDPDLLIRTSGEQRLSNFMLWQLAYAELYFSDALWPDFGEDEYRAAILAYQKRDRRFGRRRLQE